MAQKTRDAPPVNLEDQRTLSVVSGLKQIFDENKSKKICVVGATCCGKSTYINLIDGAVDMDNILSSKISKETSDYLTSKVWTREIGKKMIEVARSIVEIQPGKPIFGTVVFDCDLIVYLNITDALLRERTARRGVDFNNAKGMKQMIEEEIKKAHKEIITITI